LALQCSALASWEPFPRPSTWAAWSQGHTRAHRMVASHWRNTSLQCIVVFDKSKFFGLFLAIFYLTRISQGKRRFG